MTSVKQSTGLPMSTTWFLKLPPGTCFTHSQRATSATVTHEGAAYGVDDLRLYGVSNQFKVLIHDLCE
jgi:hypothetical protein